MPAPSILQLDAIVSAARDVLESDPSALTMAAVAARLSVRAPSLYKHVRDRDDLLDRVRRRVLDDLRATYDAVESLDPAVRIAEYARQTRAYAQAHPASKRLAFTLPDERDTGEVLGGAVKPLVDACRELVGETDALNAARIVAGWMHGFTEMESHGAFRLGGDVEESFEFGLQHILAGLTARR